MLCFGLPLRTWCGKGGEVGVRCRPGGRYKVWGSRRCHFVASMASVDPTRITCLNDGKERKSGKYVLYWMQSSVRSRCNHALEHAIATANRLDLPLVTVFGIYEKFPDANERHFAFLLEGLADVKKNLEERGVKLTVVHHPPAEAVVKLSTNAATVIVDRGYLRILRKWRATVAEKCDCSVVQVESDVVVPVEVASQKEETAARTIRKKIESNLPQYLKPVVPEYLKTKHTEELDLADMDELDISDVDAALATLDVDRSIGRVDTFLGGESEASSRLQTFVKERLSQYLNRNEPKLDVGSDLSPYLHFGHISPIEVALAVGKSKKKYSKEVQSFLEELIVRRELSMNLIFYNDNYDKIDVIPNYAKITLKDHEKDKRPHVYTEKQLEQGRTHDPYWNAAQIEVVLTGKMHTYMRMYWGKKILEWTPNPRDAFDIALRLNNRYQLDGRDPNSFTGVAWCFGKHDQGWAERSVFGKVRYMNDKGLERKFDMKGYLRKVEQIKKKYGHGKDITSYFEKRKADDNVKPPSRETRRKK